jgi:hypothetical protein
MVLQYLFMAGLAGIGRQHRTRCQHGTEADVQRSWSRIVHAADVPPSGNHRKGLGTSLSWSTRTAVICESDTFCDEWHRIQTKTIA